MNRDPASEFENRFAAAALGRGFLRESLDAGAAGGISLWTRDSADEQAPIVFLSGGIHGDEPCGPDALCLHFEQHELPDQFHWVVAPLLNPAGFRAGTRENGQGIDLNRDFFRQTSGEIRALTDWWLRHPRGCDIHLSLHEDWEAEGFYLYEINTSRMVTFANRMLKRINRGFPLQATGPVDDHCLAAPGLIVHDPEPDEKDGWPEAIWLTRTWPVLSYTIEAPGLLPASDRISGLQLALEAAFFESFSSEDQQLVSRFGRLGNLESP
jgi:murein peptide amidase A